MAKSFKELRAMSKDELINTYDQITKHTVPGLSFIAEEIKRREDEEFNQRVVDLTAQMRNLTIVITLLTIVNVIILILNQ